VRHLKKTAVLYSALTLAIGQPSYVSADETSEIARPACDAHRTGIELMAQAYEDNETRIVRDTFLQSYENEPHEPTREFMTEVLSYVLDTGRRGREYLQSDKFMTSCISVMRQKVANLQANIRGGTRDTLEQDNLPEGYNTDGRQSRTDTSRQWDMGNRR
jgi:hypothetical protein